jgi:hypothetical protein
MAMIRPLLLAVVAAFALGACAPVADTPAPDKSVPMPPKPPVAVAPPPPEDPTMKCDATNMEWARGQLADAALVQRIRTETRSKAMRVIKPGMMVTMDYREDRVNIDVDANNRVVKVRCG